SAAEDEDSDDWSDDGGGRSDGSGGRDLIDL
ncbi:hypothetical protein MTO96_035272, partial [Rhipicephalus appendiculatus]